jgi:FtsH-binding integral membrane protein
MMLETILLVAVALLTLLAVYRIRRQSKPRAEAIISYYTSVLWVSLGYAFTKLIGPENVFNALLITVTVFLIPSAIALVVAFTSRKMTRQWRQR